MLTMKYAGGESCRGRFIRGPKVQFQSLGAMVRPNSLLHVYTRATLPHGCAINRFLLSQSSEELITGSRHAVGGNPKVLY